MSGDNFTTMKLDWLLAVTLDRELSLLARSVAAILALKYLNRDNGTAWPATDTIASELGRSSTQIREALRSLEAKGHLEIATTVGGKGQTNRYRPVLKPCGKPNPSENQTLRFPEQNPPVNRAIPSGKPEGNPTDEPTDETNEGIAPHTPRSARKTKTFDAMNEDGFELFWRAYPRREARGAAMKAFAKAIQRVDLATILAGAKRYATERRNEDPKYTRHPATWLNGESWLDEPKQSHVLAPGQYEAKPFGRPSRFDAASYAMSRFTADRPDRTAEAYEQTFDNDLNLEADI